MRSQFKVLERSDIHKYQNKSSTFIETTKACGLFLGMGLGKTVITLTSIADLIESGDVKRVLIIGPLRVVNSVWRQESFVWKHLSKLRFSTCTGGERQRLAALLSPADVYLINTENITWLVDKYLNKFPFDMVIIDESGSLKNPSSKRFKKIKSVMKNVKYKVILSGTPAPNGLIDIWSQIHLLDDGVRLGKTISEYRKTYFNKVNNRYELKSPEHGVMISEKIKDIVMSMSSEDYLELPEKITYDVVIPMKPEIAQTYKAFEQSSMMLFSKGYIQAENVISLLSKLGQFANGAMYYDEYHNYTTIHDDKIDTLREMVEDNPNENFLVAYSFQSDVERLMAAFPDGVKMDKEGTAVPLWNTGKIKMLFIQPKSGGHGLNIQYGGNVIVWFGVPWALDDYLQLNARLHRQGQINKVRVYHLISQGTIDERIHEVLINKNATQEDFLAAVKCRTS